MLPAAGVASREREFGSMSELLDGVEMVAVIGDAGSGVIAASSSCWSFVWAMFCWSVSGPCMVFWSANSTVTSALASVEAPRLASDSLDAIGGCQGPFWTDSSS